MYTFSSLYHIKARWSLLFILVMCTASFQAQTNVVLHMEQLLGDRPFAFSQTTQAEMGYYFNVTRLQYYVSEITLIHDGGQRTLVPDYYLLIDPSKDSVFALGNFPVTDLEQIEFGIGVDSAHNHLDPATYPANHPLALHDPSMHWGWSGGYRFIAFEGYAGDTPAYMPNNYQIHTIAEENYHKIYLDVEETLISDTMVVPIRADYAMLLHKVDVSYGPVYHSSIGPSKQIALNMRYVFTPVITSNAHQPKQENRLLVYPNPVSDYFFVTFPWSTNGPLTLILTDLQGNTIFEKIVFTPGETINVNPSMVPGIYIATLSDGQQRLAMEKVMIH